jgi:hypothetical protein
MAGAPFGHQAMIEIDYQLPMLGAGRNTPPVTMFAEEWACMDLAQDGKTR